MNLTQANAILAAEIGQHTTPAMQASNAAIARDLDRIYAEMKVTLPVNPVSQTNEE